jgi:anti-sigma regulatory factor (Ser/Thr protein kinase)
MMLAARVVTVGAPAYTETFPRQRSAVSVARRMTLLALEEWDLESLQDSAVLICSELVTNSVEHARGNSLRLTLTRRYSGVRIAVVDLSRRQPVVNRPAVSLVRKELVEKPPVLGEHGRGLVIVDALAAKWDTDPLPWGKRVWAHLDVP